MLRALFVLITWFGVLIASTGHANDLGDDGTVTLDFSEYPFPQGTGTFLIQNDDRSQTFEYNLFDDASGALLNADNDDLADLSIRFVTSAGGTGASPNRPRLIWRNDGDCKQITGELSYREIPDANNPGTRQFIAVEVRFAPHLNITDVKLDTSSFNLKFSADPAVTLTNSVG